MEVGNINLLGLLQICQPGLGQIQGAELSQAQPGLGPGLKKFGLNIAHGGWAKGIMWGLQIK